jgi:hypothetical protein
MHAYIIFDIFWHTIKWNGHTTPKNARIDRKTRFDVEVGWLQMVTQWIQATQRLFKASFFSFESDITNFLRQSPMFWRGLKPDCLGVWAVAQDGLPPWTTESRCTSEYTYWILHDFGHSEAEAAKGPPRQSAFCWRSSRACGCSNTQNGCGCSSQSTEGSCSSQSTEAPGRQL